MRYFLVILFLFTACGKFEARRDLGGVPEATPTPATSPSPTPGPTPASTPPPTPNPTPIPLPTPSPTPTPPVVFTKCAEEGYSCEFTGKRVVRFGVEGHWVTKTLEGPVLCEAMTFEEDPAPWWWKACYLSSEGG